MLLMVVYMALSSYYKHAEMRKFLFLEIFYLCLLCVGEGNFRSSVSKAVIAGAATVGGCVILLVIITIWIYAFRQKRKAIGGVLYSNDFN